MSAILDASAVLAWLQQEAGWDRVDAVIERSVLSAANWSEVLEKAGRAGRDQDKVSLLLQSLGLRVEPVTIEDAELAANLWQDMPALSLADRLCLALAERLQLDAHTADKQWAGLRHVVVIR